MKKQKTLPTLGIKQIAELGRIFDDHDWEKVDELTGDTRFDNFCEMLCSFDENQQDLMLRLTNRFLTMGLNDHYRAYKATLAKFLSSDLAKTHKNIYLAPLRTENSVNKVTGSTACFHLLKQVNIKASGFDRKISFVDPIKDLENTYKPNRDVLCLLDDFIGTGDTARAGIEYAASLGFNYSDIAIIALAAQKTGQDIISKIVKTYTFVVRLKGITDESIDAAGDLELMNAIEEKIGVRKEFKFGYGSSEALISMLRTPNNTFPVYWLPESKSKLKVNGPFVRR